MRHPLVGLVLTCFVFVSPTFASRAPQPRAVPVTLDSEALWISSTTSDGGFAKSASDTLDLFGGPGTAEGKFETLNGIPDRQGWVGVDITQQTSRWQVSTYRAENLGNHGVGNHALWCGQTAEQAPGWVSAPGYGNNWSQWIEWNSGPLSDPEVGQTVSLDFFMNYDTEPAYDYVFFEYDLATYPGLRKTIDYADGTNKDSSGVFPAPGATFADVVDNGETITFAGGDYPDDEIRLRIRFSSDGAWSDEDGLWPTDGAVMIDDLHVQWVDGGVPQSSFEDFEGSGPFAWQPYVAPFFGEFSKVLPRLRDIDPCRDNDSPVMAFFDDGTPPSNAADAGDPNLSTGGSFSPTWNYGDALGHVVNYTGGISGVDIGIDNHVWSPPIAFELPGPEDDGDDWTGCLLEFDLYGHNPLLHAIYWNWSIDSSADGGVTWDGARNFSSLYYQPDPSWRRGRFDVSDLLVENPTHVRVRLEVRDWSHLIFYPDNDATPAPWFDNVRVRKIRRPGASMWARNIDLAQDAFPGNGLVDASTQALRDALDVRFDMARDIDRVAYTITPGDTLVVNAAPRVEGTALSDLRMLWVLDKNPFFEDAIRQAPNGALDVDVDTSDPLRWSGAVLGSPIEISAGVFQPDAYQFDLPDADFLYPGDRIRFHFRAVDADGAITTLPTDIGGFATGDNWPRDFEMRPLPDLEPSAPAVLVIDDTGVAKQGELMRLALGQIGWHEGESYDLYTVKGATSQVGNGIGATAGPGASLEQLGEYGWIVYMAGNDDYPLTWGYNEFSPAGQDGDDIKLLTDWKALPGWRRTLFFGQHLVSHLMASQAPFGPDFVQNILGVTLRDADVRDEVGDLTVPIVVPSDPLNTALPWAAYSGCPALPALDSIEPGNADASAEWIFAASDGTVFPGPAAVVSHWRYDGVDLKWDLMVPMDFDQIWDPREPFEGDLSGDTVPRRADLLRELTSNFDTYYIDPPDPTDAPSVRSLELRIAPNPFNPRTTVELRLPAPGDVEITLFDARGRTVRTLLEEHVEESVLTVVWDGRDDRGAPAASGLYFVRARVGDESRVAKAMLVR